jgi:hypothetical protein
LDLVGKAVKRPVAASTTTNTARRIRIGALLLCTLTLSIFPISYIGQGIVRFLNSRNNDLGGVLFAARIDGRGPGLAFSRNDAECARFESDARKA